MEVDSSSLVASGSVWVEVESDVGSVWLNTETLGVAVSPGGAEPDPVPTQVVMDIDSPAYRMGYSIDPDAASSGELYATGMLDLSSGAIYDDDGAVVGVLSGDGPPDDVRFVETDQGVATYVPGLGGWVGADGAVIEEFGAVSDVGSARFVHPESVFDGSGDHGSRNRGVVAGLGGCGPGDAGVGSGVGAVVDP